MRLGSQTGSLINHVMSSGSVADEGVTVGMGATVLHWTDRDGATVIGWDGKTVTVQEDTATRVDGNGMSDAQRYEYAPCPAGPVYRFRRNRRGYWCQVVRGDSGRWRMVKGLGLSLGSRQSHYDFSF